MALSVEHRALLEKAAVAAGHSVRTDLTYEAGVVINDGAVWNSIERNDDALPLLLNLGLHIDYQAYCRVRIWNLKTEAVEFWGGVGLEVGTRLAITRAAASIVN